MRRCENTEYQECGDFRKVLDCDYFKNQGERDESAVAYVLYEVSDEVGETSALLEGAEVDCEWSDRCGTQVMRRDVDHVGVGG